jgi:hypothetical protein
LKTWLELGATEEDIKKRKITLEKFLEKIKTDKVKAKPRKRTKAKTPIFATGDCLVFKMSNGNYGGAIVLASDHNPETAYNLIATTRINQNEKPTIQDFENAEVLICNFGQWQNKPDVTWCMPDLFHKDYSEIYELVDNLSVEIKYDIENYGGKDDLFKPSFTSGWNMKNAMQSQLESELTKPKPSVNLTVKRLTKKNKWWKIF